LLPMVHRLLQNDPATLRLLKRNPFTQAPPAWIRARLYHYRFTTGKERQATGAWWVRELVADYFPPVTLPRRGSTRRDTGE
jgi:hypothetical protein